MTTLVAAASPVDVRAPAARLARLVDRDTLTPLHTHDDSGVTAARGRIDGADVLTYCTDATIMGGALGAAGAHRIVETIELGARLRRPVLGVWHSGGAKLADGVESMDGVGRMFAAMTRASGVIPQISVVVGPAAGAAAYGPALTDLVVMADTGRMFVTGPDVVRSVTGEVIDMAGLGGPEAHGTKSGVAHLAVASETEAYQRARRLIGFFASPGAFHLPAPGADHALRSLLPASPKRAYDVKPLIRGLVVGFEELQPTWARNIVVGFGRLGGRSLGVVANNPLRKGGCLDSLAAEKAARFVRMCDSLGLPLLVVVDVPGYLPGVGQEWGGVVRRGAKLLHAFAEATVPRVTLITRKAYGGAYIAMNSRSLGATAVFAWPEAEIAVMGAEAAVSILHRKRLATASDAERSALLPELVAAHRTASGGVARAQSLGVVDEVIAPEDTGHRIALALATAQPGRGHHGNIPL